MTVDDRAVNEAAISPEWLAGVLRQHGIITGEVLSIEAERIGVGMGFASKMFRLRPIVSDQLSGPISFIVKMLDDEPDKQRYIASGLALEARFYAELSPTAGIPTPQAIWSSTNEATGESLILLEDLGHYDWPEPLTGCTLDNARLAVEHLATFHAQWWGAPSARELPWVSVYMDDPDECGCNYRAAWERITARHREVISALSATLGDQLYLRFPAIYDSVISGATRERLTLCHGDFRLGNIAFGASPHDASIAVVDWSTIRFGRGLTDLAHFMQGMSVEERRTWTDELFTNYHATLVAHGVGDLSIQQLHSDFRVSAIQEFYFLVSAIGNVLMTMDIDAGPIIELVFERLAALIEDHQLLDLVAASQS